MIAGKVASNSMDAGAPLSEQVVKSCSSQLPLPLFRWKMKENLKNKETKLKTIACYHFKWKPSFVVFFNFICLSPCFAADNQSSISHCTRTSNKIPSQMMKMLEKSRATRRNFFYVLFFFFSSRFSLY